MYGFKWSFSKQKTNKCVLGSYLNLVVVLFPQGYEFNVSWIPTLVDVIRQPVASNTSIMRHDREETHMVTTKIKCPWFFR